MRLQHVSASRCIPTSVCHPNNCMLCVLHHAQGAVAAGMKVVVVPSMVGAGEEEFKLAAQQEGGEGEAAGVRWSSWRCCFMCVLKSG